MALRPSGFYDFFNICLLLYLLCTLPVSLKTSTCFISTSLIFRAQRFAKYNLAYSVTPRDDEPQFYFDIFVDACLAFDIMMSVRHKKMHAVSHNWELTMTAYVADVPLLL
jgi:hypothetical protein